MAILPTSKLICINTIKIPIDGYHAVGKGFITSKNIQRKILNMNVI